MSPRSVLAAVFALELLGQGLQAQSLDDRRVGIFFGYTYADAENPSQSYVLGTSVIPNPPLPQCKAAMSARTSRRIDGCAGGST